MAQSLGPFEVQSFLARGGMGEIYTGHHVLEGYRAAIKVVPPRPRSNEALLHEVRATASLNHPGIVAVYDYGEVNATESRASDGTLLVGSLWFAMEFADAGTLEQLEPPTSWAALRKVLIEILDALAHAHAGGLVHRDLKPANILLTRRDDGGVNLLLADFGIAHVSAPDELLPETTENFAAPAAGTPRYMAPEQIQGRGRDQGPWTDLYALGCLAWELVTGQPVFDGDSALAVAMGHISSDVGVFRPRFAVPPQFETWLRMLLRKSWRQRYQRAAHAAFALQTMTTRATAMHTKATTDEVTSILSEVPTLESLDGRTTQLPAVVLEAIRQDDRTWARPAVPPVTSDWRPVRPAKPIGRRTGLGLFGLREIPVLGREDARDLLWNTLRSVSERHQARVVLLSAHEGFGKSKLLKWLGTRVEELGVGRALRVAHSAMHAPTDGLPVALGRHLGCLGLSRANVHERLFETFAVFGAQGPGIAAAVTEFLHPAEEGDDDGPALRFGSPSERYAIVEQLLRIEGAHQPVVLLIDDVQWGADAIGLVQHLMRRADEREFGVFIVMATRPSLLATNPLSRRRLDALAKSDRVQQLELPPLPRAHHVELVREQVGLSQALADELVDVVGDDTNFSLCLVGDWVSRNVLGPGPDGYQFAAGQVVEFPRDLTEAWGARLDRFCAQFSVPARVAEALEVAAAFGVEVDLDEWHGACHTRGVVPPERLVHRLVDFGIARRSESGFGFVQSAAVSSLTERSGQSGRLRGIHAHCARVIVRGAPNGASAAERRGLHLLEANERGEALAELEVALAARLETSAYDEAIAVADLYLASTPDPDEEAALVVRAKRADAMRYLGRSAETEVEARAILEISARRNSRRGSAEGLRVLAGLEHGLGHLALGIERCTEAIALYRAIDDDLGVAKCLHGRGWLYMNKGDAPAARQDFARGIELASGVDAASDVAWSRQGLAEALGRMGQMPEAERAARQSIADFVRLGSRSGHGMALSSLANIQRDRGEVDAARATYGGAIDLLASFQSQLIAFPLLHLVVLELLHGTEAALDDALNRVERLPLPPAFEIVVRIARVAQEQQAEAALSQLGELLGRTDGDLLPIVDRVLSRLDEIVDPATMARLREMLGQ